MNILVSGSSGLVGTAVVESLRRNAHAVTRLVRSPAAAGQDAVWWDPESGTLDPAGLEGLDAVIHLAGESIAAGRWTLDRKARIRQSRVRGTALLAESLARLDRKPRVLVSASAVGIYGDRGAEELDESSPPGRGFIPDLCRDWEASARPAVAAGLRTVLLRLGLVLSARGGALAKMLPLFRLGLGGRLGSGRQYMSWIAMEDLVRMVDYVLGHEELRGPVNAVSPAPVTNREWTATLGRVLHRPTLCCGPAVALRLALGEMADEMLLSSARVLPRALVRSGFQFQRPDLRGALESALSS